MTVRVAIIYYSSTGTIYRLATAAQIAAEQVGAEVRLRRVRELAPLHAISSRPEWAAHVDATAEIPEADVDDLRWADVYLFGTPARYRYGNVAAQLKQFLDMAGPLWMAGELTDKFVGGFTSASTPHGGHETTLLALYNTIHHWGSVIVPAGYTTAELFKVGNPSGVSAIASPGTEPSNQELQAIHAYTRRVIRVAAAVAPSRQERAA